MENIEIENKEKTFEVFRLNLHLYVNENFNACDDFLNGILASDNNKELNRHFKNYSDDVYKRLGGDLNDNNDGYENDIATLNDEKYDLESEIEELKGTTISDNFKYEYFIQYRDNFQEWELEELLKNGKEYLRK